MPKWKQNQYLYGKAPSSELQDYALTTFSYEDVETEIIQKYRKNDTEIKIKKHDEETKKKLQGAIFEILDEKQNKIKELETDIEGEIKLKQILPGTYYIKEIKAPEGYEINDTLIKVEVKLNETKIIKIDNGRIEIETPNNEEEVEIPTKPKEIKKLPITGM